MADFNISHARTQKFEGGYANNLADHGGETYAGIARNFWQSWSGWKHIDAAKMKIGAVNFNKFSNWKKVDDKLVSNTELKAAISDFYKTNFWHPIRGDELTQILANNLYDTAVNSGTNRAIKILQKALAVEEDGDFGPQTMSALTSLREDIVVQRYKAERLAFVHQIVQNDKTQAQFINGWVSRIRNA